MATAVGEPGTGSASGQEGGVLRRDVGRLALMFTLLEVAFIGALKPGAAAHGWANLSFGNQFGPYVALSNGLGLGWLAFVLYVDAFLSPAGTGLIYSGSSARVSYALSRNGYIPEAFGKLDKRGVPWLSIIFSFAVGMIVFLPFPGWQKLVAFITSASVIIYAAQCLSLAAMRQQLPDQKRRFRLPAVGVLAPLGFVIANWGSSIWLWPWLLGLMLLSLLSSFTGGKNDLHFGVDMAVTAVFSLAIYYFALTRRLPDETVRERMESGPDELEKEGVAAPV